MNKKPIRNELDHQNALARIDALFDAEPDTLEGDELEVLVSSVNAYEDEHLRIDPPDPIEGIKFHQINNIHPGEILLEEFLEPLEISQNKGYPHYGVDRPKF